MLLLMKRIIAVVVSLLLLFAGSIASPSQAASCGKETYMNGTVGPSVCPNGKPNKRVKKAYTRGAPAIMDLKSIITRKQLLEAMCSDAESPTNLGTNDQLYDAVAFQAARYGWKNKTIKHAWYLWYNTFATPAGTGKWTRCGEG